MTSDLSLFRIFLNFLPIFPQLKKISNTNNFFYSSFLKFFRTSGYSLTSLKFMSPKKCQLFQKEKTNVIATWPVPKDAHEVRNFLGLCSYY